MIKKLKAKPHFWEQQEIDFTTPVAIPEPVRQAVRIAGILLFMGIDPGGGCGLAVLGYEPKTETAQFIGAGTYTHSDLAVMLRHNLTGIRAVGCEEYRIYSASAGAQTGSDNRTSQTIGMIVDMCDVRSIRCDLQPASIKNPATTWARNRWPDIDLSYNSQHEKDGKAHAIWALRKHLYP